MKNEYILNENNYVYQMKTRSGKATKKLLGIKCPNCGSFTKNNPNYKGWSAEAEAHIADCDGSEAVA